MNQCYFAKIYLYAFYETVTKYSNVLLVPDYWSIQVTMEASKRPAENGSNGSSSEAKKAKLDPDCGKLLFCGTTEWHNVRRFCVYPSFNI